MKAIKICFDVIKRKTKQKILTATITLNRFETGHRIRAQVSLLSLNKYSILLFKYKHKLNVSYFLFEYKYQWMRVIKPWKRLKSNVMGVNKKENKDRFHRSLGGNTNRVLLFCTVLFWLYRDYKQNILFDFWNVNINTQE